jgi:hypothetical protein
MNINEYEWKQMNVNEWSNDWLTIYINDQTNKLANIAYLSATPSILDAT